jgi:hypothetical protein
LPDRHCLLAAFSAARRVESDRVACQATVDPVVGAEDVGMVIEDPAVMGPDLHDLVGAARGDVDEVP